MTFEQLFDIESAVESAAMAILGPEQSWNEFSDVLKDGPLIGYEVKFAGGPTGIKRPWRNIKLDCEWRGNLEIGVVTTRFQNSDKHAALLVQARIRMMQGLLLFNDSNLPFHWVIYIQELPIIRVHDRETMTDHSTLHFDLKLSVREECWLAE